MRRRSSPMPRHLSRRCSRPTEPASVGNCRHEASYTDAVVSVDEFSYALPQTAIAQTPVEPRSSARLLDATKESIAHRRVADLPDVVGPGDVLVVNNSRVIRARLQLFKATGGAVEVMLVEPAPAADGSWHALVRPGRRVPDGTELYDSDGLAVLRAGDNLGDGLRCVAPIDGTTVLALAERVGAVPLPPYITETLGNPDRYQTVYADNEGSVAAPTAGLHFTPELLAACEAAGAQVVTVELMVGLGTFRPILTDDIGEHTMHAERYNVSEATLAACRAADRVIAVGTTSVRALESAAATGELSGSTELFITPGYEFKIVDTLLTNFHQPKSSLLVLLASFCGDGWRALYEEALANHYRFLSFGDAMLVNRATRGTHV